MMYADQYTLELGEDVVYMYVYIESNTLVMYADQYILELGEDVVYMYVYTIARSRYVTVLLFYFLQIKRKK